MKVIKGNKVIEYSAAELTEACLSFDKIEIDIGTGDGRYIYKNALRSPNTFFIGIDPNQKQLEMYSKKALKNKITNISFVLNSIENLQEDFNGIADVVTINLPWGSLLQAIALPNETIITKFSTMLKTNGILKIIFGYTQETEPGEVNRLGLSIIDLNYINKAIGPAFQQQRLKLTNAHLVQKSELKNFESTWSKKLSFGKDRPIYYIELSKTN
jgi:16S rRNA (adenine(1408)-N(1))-methyltransferase